MDVQQFFLSILTSCLIIPLAAFLQQICSVYKTEGGVKAWRQVSLFFNLLLQR